MHARMQACTDRRTTPKDNASGTCQWQRQKSLVSILFYLGVHCHGENQAPDEVYK